MWVVKKLNHMMFDVLNMGNIFYFHLEHSNLHFFYFFKFHGPFISLKKILPTIGFMVLKTTGFSLGIQQNYRFGKICIGSRDIFNISSCYWYRYQYQTCNGISISKTHYYLLSVLVIYWYDIPILYLTWYR